MLKEAGRGSKIVRLVGAVLVGLSIAIVVAQLAEHRQALAGLRPTPKLAAAIVAAVGLYVVAISLLFLGWRSTLAAFLRDRDDGHAVALPVRPVLTVYARSNIAKYLPGNVLHFAGRQILGSRLGLAQASLAGATLLEQLSIAWVGGVLALAGATVMPLDLGIPQVWMPVALVAALVGPPLVLRVLGSMTPGFKALLPMVLAHIAYFALLGIGLLACAHAVVPIASPQEAARIWIGFTVAYLAGFLLPGAPAGVGVREAMFTLLLAGVLGDGLAPLIVLLYRVATTLGDVVFAGLGWLSSGSGSEPPARQ